MRYKIPIEIVELESDNYHILISSVFNDGTTINWVIDTGASKSVFDTNLTRHIAHIEDETEDLHSASKSEEPLSSSVARLKSLVFGKMKVEKMKVALLDMNHINELYEKVSDIKIGGLLGSDFLLKNKAVVDYKKKRLVLSV
jgi:hypothetical protein